MFLVIHNETNAQPGTSVYHIVHRHEPKGQVASFEFRKLTDPVEPFGSDKTPHHSVLRIRDYPPNLLDLLVVSSTSTDSIGLLTRSKTPLASDKPAEQITDVFTTTEFADDSKRAQLPMSEENMNETFPIGVSLDLSSKDKVYKPIPSEEEIEYSPGPLPALWALNNDGVLSCWWILYTDAIRQGATYPGMAALEGASTTTATPSSPAPANPFGAPATSSSAFGQQSTLGAKPSPFSAATSSPAATTSSSAFGSHPFSGAAAASGPSFGTPSFGSSTFGSKPSPPAFGQSSMGLGMRTSPWAAGSAGTAAPAFGQHGFGGAAPQTGKVFGSSTESAAPSTGKVFGSSATSAAPASGGFAGFASNATSGFGSLGGASSGQSIFSKPAGDSPFGKPAGESVFGKPADTSNSQSVFGKPSTPSVFGSAAPEVSMDADTAFPPPASKPSGAPALGSSPFVLGTTFKADPVTANDNETPTTKSGGSMFGSGFGLSLGDTAKPSGTTEPPKDEDMDATTPVTEQPKPKSVFSLESTTPTTTPAPVKFFRTSPPPKTGLFSGPKPSPNSFNSLFGKSTPASEPSHQTSIFAKSTPAVNPFSTNKTSQGTPEIKVEPEKKTPDNPMDAPLPPESTSKAAYPLGESSSSSNASTVSPDTLKFTPGKVADVIPLPLDIQEKSTSAAADDAPLPPDFLSKPAKKVDDAPLPPDFLQDQTKSKAEEAPLPPDFLSKPKESAAEDAPLPPDFLAKPQSKSPAPEAAPLPSNPFAKLASQIPEPSSSEEDDLEEDDLSEGEDEDEDEDGEGEEEVEEDEEEEEQEGSEPGTEGSGVDVAKDLSPTITGAVGFTPQSSFGGMGGSTFSSVSRPEPSRLFGEVNRNAPVFPQPVPVSPRSPSPVRGAIPPRILRSESSRSVSAPGMASQILGARKPSASVFGRSNTARGPPEEDLNVALQKRAQEKKEKEESQTLEDEEYEHIQHLLESELEPAVEIGDFTAFTPGVTNAEASTVASQAEALYRDINGMMHVLGLNARALAGFIKGHTELFKESGRSKEDLDDPDSWVLCEADDLGEVLDDELAKDLIDGRLKDFDQTWDACQDLLKELPRLRAKQEDMKRVIATMLDPDQIAATRSLPLSAEQATQQNDLRRAYAHMTRLLAEAEGALTMLRTKIASAAGAAGKNAAVPTVEAIMKTIMKMTSMAEKRSGDIDVLENQMRKLRFSSVGSREGSPFKTPPRRSIQSPDPRKSLTSSVTSYGARAPGTPPRKKLSGFSEEEKSLIRQKREKKQAVLGRLKASLEKSGPNVSRLTDED